MQAFLWPRIVVYGAGAVGCYFGAKLAEAGAPVMLIGRAAHMDAIRRDGLLFESGGSQRRIAIDATTEHDALREAGIVLVCVKTRDSETAASDIAPHLRFGAIVVSLQNGVDNVERMRAAGVDALGAVVYVAAAMAGPGHLRHSGRGDLVVGEIPTDGPPATPAHAPSARALAIRTLFERAGVPCSVEADVRVAMWDKFVLNCAYNAISALTGSRYGPMIDTPDIRALMRQVIDECVAVAHAQGVPITDTDAQYEAALRLGEAMRGASSSMDQDLSSGRPTEIDAMNGYIAAHGDAHQIATPANRMLTTLVRLAEQTPRRQG